MFWNIPVTTFWISGVRYQNLSAPAEGKQELAVQVVIKILQLYNAFEKFYEVILAKLM